MDADTFLGLESPASPESGVALSQADIERAERRLALAIWKAEHDQPDAAQRLFEEALSLNPTNAAFRMTYAAFVARREDWAAARRELEQAVADDGVTSAAWLEKELASTPSDPSLMHLQALLLTCLGRYGEAQAAFERLLIVVPGHGQALADQAALLEATGDLDAADRSYRAALDVNPANVIWLTAYGTFLEKCERDEEALRALERALELNREDIDLRERVAKLKLPANREVEARKRAALAKLRLEEQDNVDEATALIADALQVHPECALAHRVQADLLRRRGLLAQAEAHLSRAVELEPDNREYRAARQAFQGEMEPRRQQVQILISQARAADDREVACAMLDKALSLIADDADAHFAYAELLWPNRPGDVEQHLQAVLAVEPQNVGANRLYAILLCNEGRGGEAEQHFLAALAQQPQDEELTDEYAGSLIEQGRYQEAANLLQAALEVLPTSARLQGRLAVAGARLGRLAEAMPQFETALQVDPQSAMLHREYAVVLRDTGQRVKAEEHFRAALELNDDDATAHREYAALLVVQQRYLEARDHIQRARYLRPEDPKTQAEAETIEDRLHHFEQVEEELAYAVWLSRKATPDAIFTAREAFDHARELDPNSVVALKEYAMFLESLGELDRTRDLLEMASRIIPEDKEIKARLQALATPAPPPPPPNVRSEEIELVPELPKSLWQSLAELVRRLFGG
jgi:Tfp pilus assembly protein PilF